LKTFFDKREVKRIRSTCLNYSRVEVAADAEKSERTGKTGTSVKAVKFDILVKSLKSHEILMWLKRH